MRRISRLTVGLLAALLVFAAPVAAFALWNSLGHWKTTSLTFGEYYYLPLAICRYYLLTAYGIELVVVLPLVLLWNRGRIGISGQMSNKALDRYAGTNGGEKAVNRGAK